jgi:hypothetical protein
MLPATIATSVAPETIAKVGRLFNGSAHDVLSELLQNARRAGAGSVTVTTAGNGGDRLIHIVDDGSGIADPAAVVTLGRSGWSEDTKTSEDPAGMGVFSLAGRDVIIRSWSQPERQGWMTHIPAGAWESSRPIVVSKDPIAQGTAITVRMPQEWSDGLEGAIRQVARHYPLPVTFNGEPVEQKNWLAGAILVEEWNGCRIGIFREESAHSRSGDPRLNFHGVTIPLPMSGIGEVGRGQAWNARVDIVDCPAIQLVLPARKEAVQNAALEALRTAITAAIFRTIAAQPAHRLSFDSWSKARSIGIEIAEADPYLLGWIAPHADYGENYLSGTRVSTSSMVIMPPIDALIAQPAALALTRHSPFGGELVCEEPAFTGYRWYDTLARVEMIGFEIIQDGRCFAVDADSGAPADVDNGYVDTLDLIATVSHGGAYIDVRCAADLAFAADHDLSSHIDDLAVFVRRETELVSGDVVELLQRAAFDPNSDSDADSHDTQRSRFVRDATERVVGILEGSDAAIEIRVRSLLSSYPWLVPSDRRVTVTMTRDGLVVTVAERTPEAE